MPTLLKEINEYIAIKFGVIEMNRSKQSPQKEQYNKCYVQIVQYGKGATDQKDLQYKEKVL